ncbi:glycosyltransferase family 2 protein [Pedobacter sp. ASV1-7]|uniref:glycosyltransferase family 2 protein n=1 Tax=Pedobacter sp. ASV1-7 TaxID=3145237 RepID=UPI0032E8798B
MRTVTLLISTYNWPEALELILLSVKSQTSMPDEIVIADDGSDQRTKSIIEKYQSIFKIPLKHVWHEDKGFRKTIILNMAIAKATSDYIVQIDGDIIIHKRFIEDHLKFAKENSFVRASRAYIDERTTKGIMKRKQFNLHAFSKGITNVFSVLRIPLMWPVFETSYKNKGNEVYEIHGCNMAYWRKDIIKVNGYNELFNGWGPEDKELIARMMNAGIQKRFIKLGALAFHLYHKENSRKMLEKNTELFEETIAKKLVYCEKGINQYL